MGFLSGSGFSNVLNQINNWHPLSGIVDAPVIDPYLQGDLDIRGNVKKGSYVEKKNQNLGVEDMQQAATFFAQTIAPAFGLAALFGSMGASGGESTTFDPEAVGTGAPSQQAAPSSYGDPNAVTPQNSMPAAQPESDPTFGGQLQQTVPGVYAAPPSGGGGGGIMPAAQPEADPTFGGQLQQTSPGTYQQPQSGGNVGGGADQQTLRGDAKDDALKGAANPEVPDTGSGQSGPETTLAERDFVTGAKQGPEQNPTLMSQAMQFLSNNKGTLIPLALTAPSLLGEQKKTPNEGDMRAIAEQQRAAGAQSQQLMQPLATDTLPASQQASLDQSTNSIKSQIRAKYAKMGLSGSTMEQQELQNVDQSALALKGQIEQQLFQAGTAAAGLSNNAASIYAQLAQMTLSKDQQLQNALSRLAGAYAMGSASKGS